MTNMNFTMRIFIGERTIVEVLNIQLMVLGKNVLNQAINLRKKSCIFKFYLI